MPSPCSCTYCQVHCTRNQYVSVWLLFSGFSFSFSFFFLFPSSLHPPPRNTQKGSCFFYFSTAAQVCPGNHSADQNTLLPFPQLLVCRLSHTLRAPLSGTFLQTLPYLVMPLKGHSLSPRSCPPTRSAPPERFGY